MLNMLLLCCGLLQGIQAVLGADPSCGQLQKAGPGLEGVDRALYPSLLRRVRNEGAADPQGESRGGRRGGTPLVSSSRPSPACPGPQSHTGPRVRCRASPKGSAASALAG